MAEAITLGLFLLGLGVCLVFNLNILFGLVFGLFLFMGYSIRQGKTIRETFLMLPEGVRKVGPILTILMLIGALTASWRIGGTIPYLVFHALGLIRPEYFTLCAFLFCAAMSFLTGTSFGTVSTIGVIFMMLSDSAGANPLLTAGAILSGIFYGDRGSPMSSSAQLISTITKTNIYWNARGMFRTSAVPLIMTCAFYLLAGNKGAVNPASALIFRENFNLHWTVIIPAFLILLLALFRVNVRLAMAISIVSACVSAICIQGVSVNELVRSVFLGYHANGNAKLAALINGGGVLSMLNVAAVVAVAACYSGIFAHTDLLSGIKRIVHGSADLLTPFGSVLATSVFANAFSCNQTLAVMLTDQMCGELYKDKTEFALALENSAILIAPLVPWSIAGAVPIHIIGASVGCLAFAVYLYVVPVWTFALELWKRKIREKPGKKSRVLR